MPHHDVEIVTMRHEKTPTVRRRMDSRAHHLDATEGHADILSGKLVVVARDIDHPGALADFAKQLLDDVVVGLRPIPAASEAPAIDDVADEVDGFRIVVFEEVEDELVLATASPKMEVGHEEGAIAGRALRHSDPRRFIVGACRVLPSSSAARRLGCRQKSIQRLNPRCCRL